MKSATLLVRHTQVARAWHGRCYGVSDMRLSRAGAAHARSLAPRLAEWRPDAIVHSGLRRARVLAKAVAAISGAPVTDDRNWRERDFADWEGRSWAAIYRETGNAMDGMIDDPAGFRPGGGETTLEMAARAVSALNALPAGRVLIVTHGGPIAAIMGTTGGIPPRDWPPLVPPPGGSVELPRR